MLKSRVMLRRFLDRSRSFAPWVNRWDLHRNGLIQIGWSRSQTGEAVDMHGCPIPWLTYSATEFIDQVLSSSGLIVEVGAGNSTLWWLRRGNSVVALEASEKWINQVTASAQAIDKANLDIIKIDSLENAMSVLENLELPEHPLAILLDGIEPREPLVEFVLALCADSTVVIWDNTDLARPWALDLMSEAGYTRLKFNGLGPVCPYSWETSVFLPKGFEIAVSQ